MVEDLASAHPMSPHGVVTISGGVTAVTESDPDSDAPVMRADANPYQAKQSGRNMVVASPARAA